VIRVLALVPKAPGISPGQRFRLEQWAPHLLADHGIKLELCPFESPALTDVLYEPGRRFEKVGWLLRDTWRRRNVLALARAYDAVVIYREVSLLGPAIYEQLLAAAGVPLILDFDDAIWMPSAGGVNGVFSRLRFASKTRTICNLSRAVVVGNEYLAAWARPHSRNVFVVPTSIELASYGPLVPPRDADPFTIVWTGSIATLRHLERARPAIEALGRRRAVRLRIICSRPPERPFAGVENVFVPWTAATESRDLGPAHVGIMPIPDDAFARGKCGCKALQYMGVAHPVVVSPVGVNAQIVRDGENGLHASTDAEWVEALEKLASSPELRERLGRAGRSTVERGFTSAASAALFAKAVYHSVPDHPITHEQRARERERVADDPAVRPHEGPSWR